MESPRTESPPLVVLGGVIGCVAGLIPDIFWYFGFDLMDH